jgi:formate hydrogenlyase subunit 3/multisubunit Na+/H+ antiporter MnhD subunit
VKKVKFSNIAFNWVLAECMALLARILIHPQGHFGALNAGLFLCLLGLYSLVGLGFATIFWALLRLLQRTFHSLSSQNESFIWMMTALATCLTLTATFAFCFVNQVFEDSDPYEFIVMVCLAIFACVQSFRLHEPATIQP